MTLKHRPSYGLTRKGDSVSVSNGSGWRGEIMNVETQQSKLVLLNQMSKGELAKVLVELIRCDREVQRAILNFAFSCPNIMTQI